ncbi:nucleotide-diphospho-sugar transferase [Penicillium alfredii]|uniref:Nucleotide-diphospho-sugar transferase n=1 Tax=Penicillium alfredii TaxID=1506179 RepID=A0A9W9EMW3_9EURO|nr:nucleotide-diphospho-sugar transferase [Penicillium alfredii]KAJ5084624.1 nucleotide-diphospho-sugar transferase [Penicillium alfredii]
MPQGLRHGASRRILVIFLTGVLLLKTYWLWHGAWGDPIAAMPLIVRQARMWQDFHSLLEQHAPTGSPPLIILGAGAQRFNPLSDSVRQNYIYNAVDLLQPMQEAHDGFVKAIQAPIDPAYVPRTKGIVSAAGGTYLPTFVVSLRMLRRTGSTLPVELFLKDWGEYEPYICGIVLPALNAQCRVISAILVNQETEKGHAHKIEHYQIKSFAMLFSSFESFLWMDADCFPLHDPSILLNYKPFTSTGLVTWPDFWTNTMSPIYLNISRQPELPTSARQATEAGVILVSKRSHFHTLLLSAYYNFHGPSWYYMLLNQESPGTGDKDTYLQAATALGAKFYAVSEPVADLGNRAGDGGVQGAAMLQADPIQDYDLTSRGKWRVRDPSVAKAPRGFFIHATNPEFNPGKQLMGEKSKKTDGTPGRLWTADESALRRFGYDAEKAYWEEAKTVACTLEHNFVTWRDKSGICQGMQEHWGAIFEDPDAEAPIFTTGLFWS